MIALFAILGTAATAIAVACVVSAARAERFRDQLDHDVSDGDHYAASLLKSPVHISEID
jgi:hypothetical protein